MYRNTTHTSFEGDLQVLRRSKLHRNHEYSSLVQAVEQFQRELKLSSLQCKDRIQLNQQWEDQQFYRVLVRMMHEVVITTGVKQKDDLKKVYQWYQANRSVLHSQPHFQAAAVKEIHKRPVLQFTPDVVKYYSTSHDKRRQKQVTFDGDGKSKRTWSSHGRVKEGGLEGAEFDEGRDNQRPVTAPAGLNRPKVSNSLSRSPESSRPGSGHDDPTIAARFIKDHLSVSQASPSAQDLDGISVQLKTNIDPEDYLDLAPTNHSTSTDVVSHTDIQSDSLKINKESPK